MAVNFSLNQRRIRDEEVRRASRPGREGTALTSRGRREPVVELTIRRRPAGSLMGSKLAERIYRNANPARVVRVPLSQAKRARRDLDRDGYRIEHSRTRR